MKSLLSLLPHELQLLAAAVGEGRLTAPLNEFSVQRVLGRRPTPELLVDLSAIFTTGPAGALRLAAAALSRTAAPPELVWTGPDELNQLRSTSTVVDQLLRQAKERITLAGFVIVKGDEVFSALAQRMDAEPQLKVTLFLNVPATRGAPPDASVNWFATEFREQVWPGERVPIVYYDPRSLEADSKRRAVLHAKCVVIDDTRAFVTSANFTEAAQARNIEAGVVVEDAAFAKQLRAQFDGLVAAGIVRFVAGLGGGA